MCVQQNRATRPALGISCVINLASSAFLGPPTAVSLHFFAFPESLLLHYLNVLGCFAWMGFVVIVLSIFVCFQISHSSSARVFGKLLCSFADQ